jgi:hypothetical protein
VRVATSGRRSTVSDTKRALKVAALVADGRQEEELTGPQVAAAKKELGL